MSGGGWNGEGFLYGGAKCSIFFAFDFEEEREEDLVLCVSLERRRRIPETAYVIGKVM